MFFTKATIFCAAALRVVLADITFDSAAFNGSSNTAILWTAPGAVDATDIDRDPPTIVIDTWNVTSSFIAIIAYNYTATTAMPNSTTSDQNETDTVTRWLWLQTDMTLAWVSEYPTDEEATGATLTNTSSPLIPYNSPTFPSQTANLTLQIYQQTPALESYLSSFLTSATSSASDTASKLHHNPEALETYLEHLQRFLSYDSSLSAELLQDTPRAAIYFEVKNSTGVVADPNSLPATPTVISVDEPVTVKAGNGSIVSLRSAGSRDVGMVRTAWVLGVTCLVVAATAL